MKSKKELIKVGLLFAVIILVVIIASRFALGERFSFPSGFFETIKDFFGGERQAAQLLLIGPKTYNPGTNNIGDIVGIFDADHQFSQAEKEGFIIIRINGVNREQVETELQKVLPDGSTEEMQTIQPKYRFNVSDISKNQMTELELKNSVKTNK